jgi:hypothetical protein
MDGIATRHAESLIYAIKFVMGLNIIDLFNDNRRLFAKIINNNLTCQLRG